MTQSPAMHSLVLIVDDEVSNRKTLQFLLAPLGYTLEFAADGVEALEKAAQLTPDLMLLDVMMPRMDGFEVCRQLRANPVLAEVPVIMVTALDDRDSLLQGIQAGADDFISKPFDRLELRSRVQTIVRLNRYRRLTLERTRFAWVVDHSDDGYVITNERGEVTYANAKARRYLGLPESADQPITGTFASLAERHYRWESDEARASGQTPFYLIRPETAYEPTLWLRVSELAQPNPNGADHIIHLRDVTTQVSLWREMWSFNTSVMHKLRTPLALMAHSLELLDDFAETAPPHEIKQVATIAQRSLERLRAEVDDVLQYVKAPTAALEGDGFLMGSLESLVRELTEPVGLSHVDVFLADALAGVTVRLTRRAMELILRETMENAHKFHPHQSPQVTVSAQRQGEMVLLNIGDDGVNLSPAQLARVWNPFYQIEKSLTGQVAGMGLGLSMVAVLVMTAGGSCKAANRPDGPGIIIELRVPLVPEAAPITGD
jgi:CheY-like chemotaxis protein